jgi:hypothetical protein
MAKVTRTGILAIALTVGLSLAIGASPALARKSPGRKCETSLKRNTPERKGNVARFLLARDKRLQRCANKAMAVGASLDDCFAPATLKPIKDTVCSSTALDELGYKQECSSLDAACDLGPIVDAASLTACLDCHLNQGTRCMAAATYNATAELASCFLAPSVE